MAATKSKGPAMAYPSNDYQCEEDVRTLTRAAEVLADRGRMSMAMKKFKKTRTGMDKLVHTMSSSRVRSNTGGY